MARTERDRTGLSVRGSRWLSTVKVRPPGAFIPGIFRSTCCASRACRPPHYWGNALALSDRSRREYRSNTGCGNSDSGQWFAAAPRARDFRLYFDQDVPCTTRASCMTGEEPQCRFNGMALWRCACAWRPVRPAADRRFAEAVGGSGGNAAVRFPQDLLTVLALSGCASQDPSCSEP